MAALLNVAESPYFFLSFLNKTMFSFDLLIMIHTVDLFFYLFVNGMSDIDAIIFFKWFLCVLFAIVDKEKSWVAYS